MRAKWPEQIQNWRNYWICDIKRCYLAPLTVRSQRQIQPQHLHTWLCKASKQFPKHVCDPHLTWRKQAEKRVIYLSLCYKLEVTFRSIEACFTSAPKERTLGGCRESREAGLQKCSFKAYLPSLTLRALSPVWRWIPPPQLSVLPLDESCLLKAWNK